jgi:hypothetical protein
MLYGSCTSILSQCASSFLCPCFQRPNGCSNATEIDVVLCPHIHLPKCVCVCHHHLFSCNSPFHVCSPCPQGDLLLPLQPPHLSAVLMKLLSCVFHNKLLWFRVIVKKRVLSRLEKKNPIGSKHTREAINPSSSFLQMFLLNLSSRLAAVADALLGMVDINLLSLLP